jgi:hypothetical protein
MEVLYGGLGIGKLWFLIPKKLFYFSAVNFFQFLAIKALDPYWIRIGIRPIKKARYAQDRTKVFYKKIFISPIEKKTTNM